MDQSHPFSICTQVQSGQITRGYAVARFIFNDEMHWMPLRQIGVKIRDLDGYYLQALLDKQKQVESHMQGSTPSLLNLALERRNQLLEKAFEESKVGDGNWLVVWNMFHFSTQLGMSSSQLTNS